MNTISTIFPPPIHNLPQVKFPFKSVTGFLSQADNHQIVFMQFSHDTQIPEHTHQSQWEIVINGKVDLFINGIKKTYKKGENFFIKENQPHAAHVYKGYAAIAFFNEKSRYSTI